MEIRNKIFVNIHGIYASWMSTKFKKKKLDDKRLGNYRGCYIESISKIINKWQLIHPEITTKRPRKNNKINNP